MTRVVLSGLLTSWTEITFVVEPLPKYQAWLSEYFTGLIQWLRCSSKWKIYIL